MDIQVLKVDKTRLMKISTYAKKRNLTVQRIYQLVNDGTIKIVEIDGVKFIYV
jgi:hypothetical protein